MIIFTAGGALYETFAARYPCEKRSLRVLGPLAIAGSLQAGDVLIHNAANLSPDSLDTAVQDNFILTRDLVKAVIAAGFGKAAGSIGRAGGGDNAGSAAADVRFIFISSMSILGPGGVYKDPLEMNAYSLLSEEPACRQQRPVFDAVL
jgi:hypothetical protein